MEELGRMGTTDKTKKRVNILSEMLLIMACYFLCGVIRVYLPWGRAYAFRDTLAYGYLAVLYTAVFVLIHDLSGGYKSLKFGGFRREILRIAVGELLGCLVMTSVIYIFRLEQFSRLLLILFLLCSAAALLVKRIVVSHFYMKYSQTKGSFNVLLVGAGPATAGCGRPWRRMPVVSCVTAAMWRMPPLRGWTDIWADWNSWRTGLKRWISKK